MRPRIGITCSTADGGDGSFNVRACVNLSYFRWLTASGGLPLLLPNIEPELADEMLDTLDGLVLAGGADVHPLCYGAEPEPGLGTVDVPRDRFELPLARAALARELPILGICRGIQVLNVAAGGTLRQDLNREAAATVQHTMRVVQGPAVQHTVRLTPETRLGALVGEPAVAVNSFHHQAVGRLGDGLVVVARAADETIEAVEAPGERFVVAVQWHPEVMGPDDVVSQAIFGALIEASAAARQARR